jgi:hypothetical protein
MIVRFLIFIVLGCIMQACKQADQKVLNVSYTLDEKCLIYNQEQNNEIEGTYLIIERIINDSSFQINLPDNFYINKNNHSNWTIGWGNQTPYFDNGSENCALIHSIDYSQNIIVLKKTAKGKGIPEKGQKIVFWNTSPNAYKPYQEKAIISPFLWPDFKGESMGFSKVIFDEKHKVWICFTYEVDTETNDVYLAVSEDLINWKAGNDGQPILTNSDFRRTSWANNKKGKTPFVSDVYFENNRYYIFVDGINIKEIRSIGLIEAEDILQKNSFKIHNSPILKNGLKGRWNEQSCFNAKVCKTKKGYRMAFTGVNSKHSESVGIAQSTTLTDWTLLKSDAVIKSHKGWRSKTESSEACYLENKNDTLFLIVAGTKAFQYNWLSKLKGKQFMDIPGNVDDAQLGLYFSTNFGQTFTAHKNNPIWVNNYINPYENEHMGGNISLIDTDSMSYIFTQIKTSFPTLKYSVYLKYKPKKRGPRTSS